MCPLLISRPHFPDVISPLSLNDNSIGADGVRHLADGMKFTPGLQTLVYVPSVCGGPFCRCVFFMLCDVVRLFVFTFPSSVSPYVEIV